MTQHIQDENGDVYEVREQLPTQIAGFSLGGLLEGAADLTGFGGIYDAAEAGYDWITGNDDDGGNQPSPPPAPPGGGYGIPQPLPGGGGQFPSPGAPNPSNPQFATGGGGGNPMGYDPAPNIDFVGPDPRQAQTQGQWVDQIIQVLQYAPGLARELAKRFNFVRNDKSEMSHEYAACAVQEMPQPLRKGLYQYMCGFETPMGDFGRYNDVIEDIWMMLALAESGFSPQICKCD